MKKQIVFLMLFISAFGISQKKLPSISLITLDGKSIATSQDFLEKDKIYIFCFWATWCAPCIQELDEISEVYEDWKSEINVEVIAVSIDDARTNKRVKPLVNGKGWEYLILLDTNQDFKRSLGISNPPFTAIVKNGEIVFTQNGHTPGSENTLFEYLKSIK
jgi:thiol-disulfide isomerase/thioredoxin